jgi:hypothetical protein
MVYMDAILAVAQQPIQAPLDRLTFESPVVRQAFERYHYTLSDFDLSKTQVTKSVGSHGETLFVTTLKPVRMPPNTYPCVDPALVVSLGSPQNAGVVLPHCATVTSLFELDGDLYLAVTTQTPTPPEAEAMNPDVTEWLLRVGATKLTRVWPPA